MRIDQLDSEWCSAITWGWYSSLIQLDGIIILDISYSYDTPNVTRPGIALVDLSRHALLYIDWTTCIWTTG